MFQDVSAIRAAGQTMGKGATSVPCRPGKRLWIIGILGALVAVGGCDPRPTVVQVLEIGPVRLTYATYDPSRYHDPEEARLARAFILYQNEHLREAFNAFENLYESRFDGTARAMAATIRTRWNHHVDANQLLKRAVDDCPSCSFPRTVRIWSLAEQGRLKEAEQEAATLATQSATADGWEILREIRRRIHHQRVWEKLSQVFVVVVFLVATVILVGILWGLVWDNFLEAPYRQFLFERSIRESAQSATLECDRLASELTEAAMKSEFAESLREAATRIQLNTQSQVLNALAAVADVYRRAAREIDGSSVTRGERAERRNRLEAELRAVVARFTSTL